MECCLTESGKICMEKLIDKALAELRHVFCFTSTANEFKEKKTWLEAKIKTLEQHAKVAAGNDKDVEADYHLWKEKAEKLVQEDILTKQKCFFGLCPDCIWRYRKGKELANNIEEIKQLIEKGGTFENIEISRRLPDVERYSSKDYISFPSRDSKYKELLDALKDDNNYMIVLQGMGGTGKTTLAKEVGKELKKSEQFAHVIDTTVSFTPDTKKIQDDIAGSLGLKWNDCNDSDRPKKLWSRLTTDEKVLLIMDDVWDQGSPLDFDLIGIPKKDNHKGCRVLITTRSKQIFNIMGCDKIIELDLLPEEDAWTMFKMYAGIINNSSKSLIATGREIAKECKQLPVAIAVIASSLKGQQDRKHKWDTTLRLLKETVSMDDVDEEKVGIYKCLKSSYDGMKNENAKGLFLLSSIFPEDKQIPIEILTRLGIGTGLFGKNYRSYNDFRNQVVVAKDKLIDSCLLVGVSEEHVKMHDLVREAAQWIAYKEIRHVNLSNQDEKSSLQKEKNLKYLFCEGKDMDMFSWKYDGSKLETLILDVERDEDRKCMEAPNSFLENSIKLQVLYISGHDNRTLSLPYSINSLANIRSILVDKVDLGDISILGNLQSLETLDLVSCEINELPHEIAKLGKLKLLNLERCEIRRNDPFEVIKRCSTLEELYFIDSFNHFCRDITFPKLQRYRIRKGWTKLPGSLSKYVLFNAGDGECFFSKETLKFCMQTTEGLELVGIKERWRNLMPEIVPINLGMKDLVELRLRRISQLQYLIDTNGSQVPNVLSKLVVLELEEMENLEELFNGSLAVDFLKNLEKISIQKCKMFQGLFNCKLNLCNLKTVALWHCPMLVNLFDVSTSQNLVVLEKLVIVYCEGLTNIIVDERGEEESRDDKGNKSYVSMFPKLKVLHIAGCHQLESILPLLSSQDLPDLEMVIITKCDKLKYIFGQYQNLELGSLKDIDLSELPNFMGIFPKSSHPVSSHVSESSISRDGFKAKTQVDPVKCNIFPWGCIYCHGSNYRHKLGNMSTTKVPSVHEDSLQKNSTTSVSSSQPLQCFLVQSQVMCNIKEITLSGPLKIKYVFILSITPKMLVETLTIRTCDELKHIIVDTGDDGSGGNNWGDVFPKLKKLYVENCMQLEYIFGHYTDYHPNHNEIHIHLPKMEYLTLRLMPNLVSMCPKQYYITLPPLKALDLTECSQVAIKSIGEFIINHSDSKSLDCTMTKELSGSMENFTALESLEVRNSKAENIFCLNEREGQPLKLSLERIYLYDLRYMMCLFVGPKNSFALQNLTVLSIMHCEILEVVFSTSILRCLSQLFHLKIENCKELKHIIEDDRQNQNLSLRTCFPKLAILNVKNCPKLKCVFPVSIYKLEFPELRALMIEEAYELEEIFKSEGDQEVIIPNLNFPKLQRLIVIKCHKLKYVFPISIYKELRVLEALKIEEANELEEIFKSESDQEVIIPNLNSSTCFPKPKSLVVTKCHKLKYVFPVSTCKELLKLETLVITKSHELEEIFKCKGDQKIEIPNLNIVVLDDLPNLFHTQGILFQAAKNRFVQSCQNLSLTSASTLLVTGDIDQLCSYTDHSTIVLLRSLFRQLEEESTTQDTCNENSSAETKKDVVASVGIEIEAVLGHEIISSQKLEKEQGLINQQDPLGKINTTIKPSQGVEQEIALTDTKILTTSTHLELISSSQVSEEDFAVRDSLEIGKLNDDQEISSAETTKAFVVGVGIEVKAALEHGSTSSQITMKQTPSVAVLPTTSKELEKKQPPSELGEIDTTIKPSQGVEEGITNTKTITSSTHFELFSSSQMKEQDIDVRDSLETTMINIDRVSLCEDVIMKESPIVEEQFSKGDEFSVQKSKPSSSNSVPLPLAFHAPSIHFEGKSSQKVEDLSSPYLVARELEELVSKKHLDYENLSLLTDFLVKHPSVLLSDKHSNGYKGQAYKFLIKLLKFLQTHSVLDVLGSCHSEFVELLHDVRGFTFDKDRLDGVENRALFPNLKFSQDTLQKLLDSKKNITEDIEVVRFKIDILNRNMEELTQQLSSSKADLESIIQQEKKIVESKAALTAPLGY